jgi:[acyl-carrier-protein] S-malonyltransferase
MKKYALLFPGQGSQKVNMGLDLIERDPTYKKRIDFMSHMIGTSMTDILQDENRLNKTRYAQLAIVLVSSMIHDEIIKAKIAFDAVAGFSLGEYIALWATGVLTFEDMIEIVFERAKLMERAARNNPGKMMAVLGLEQDVVKDALDRLDLKRSVVIANVNAPGQIVMSGTEEGLEQARRMLMTLGAKRLIFLNVEGAFHSPLMEQASLGLAEVLLNYTFKRPTKDLYMNTTGTRLGHEDIKNLLVDHMTKPVLFDRMIRNMSKNGMNTFIEAGFGGVLSGLVRRIDRDVETISIGSALDLHKLKGWSQACV